jgi:hypothetical protein
MIRVIITIFALLLTFPALAGDVHVRGYTRSDGTYVKPHVRSAPDSTRANNYGPGNAGPYPGWNGRHRDADGDGTPNYRDMDDDNDGTHDDYDAGQYNPNR